MSYTISLYTVHTKEKEQQLAQPDFFEKDECIFEVGMTASEFTDTGEFAKYDPQAGGWEEL